MFNGCRVSVWGDKNFENNDDVANIVNVFNYIEIYT